MLPLLSSAPISQALIQNGKEKEMKYRVIEGSHDQYGKIYSKGDVLDVDMDLIAMFPNKFEKASKEVPITKAPAAPTDIIPMVPQKNPPAPLQKEEKTNRGKDVTEKFPDAVDMDFKVFIKNRKHYVYDVDDMAKPINSEPLKKGEVKAFIESKEE